MKRIVLFLLLVLFSTNAYAQQTSDLMGVGMPAAQASLLAEDPGTIAAAGAALATATSVGDYEVVYVTASDGAKGVILSSNTPYGKCIRVINTVAAILLVYPHSATAQINAAGAGVANSLGASGTASYCRVSDLAWYADGSATGSYTGDITVSGDIYMAGGDLTLTGDPINDIFSNAGANTSQVQVCIEAGCTSATGAVVGVHGIADATAGEQGTLVLQSGNVADADADVRITTGHADGDVEFSNPTGITWYIDSTNGIFNQGPQGGDFQFNTTPAKVYNEAGASTGILTICLETTCNATTGAFVSVAGVGHASVGDLVLSTGDDAGGDLIINLAANNSLVEILQDDATTVNFQITQAGVWGSSAGVDLGIEYVTAANTACTTTCAVADGGVLFGVDLAAGASQPVIVEADAATADACVCLERAS